MKYCLMGVAVQKLGTFTLTLSHCLIYISCSVSCNLVRMRCEILLPDVVIKESSLYDVREVQVLVPMKQHATAGK